MKTAQIIVRHKFGHQRDWGSVFAEGLKCHGWTVNFSTEYSPANLIVMWGVRRQDVIARAKADGCEVCILERGYIADRFNWTSVSFGGGLNGRAEFRGPFEDASRWQRYFSDLMKPWDDREGGPALIIGQVPGDMSLHGVNINSFYEFAKRAYEKLGIRTRFRPQPNVQKIRPLSDELNEAQFVVTWNSNAAVEAILAGVPAVGRDEGSMAWDVAGHSLSVPPKPNREAWAHALAWKQWGKAEMISGYCWEHVRGDL
jgi:hypothetical protein